MNLGNLPNEIQWRLQCYLTPKAIGRLKRTTKALQHFPASLFLQQEFDSYTEDPEAGAHIMTKEKFIRISERVMVLLTSNWVVPSVRNNAPIKWAVNFGTNVCNLYSRKITDVDILANLESKCADILELLLEDTLVDPSVAENYCIKKASDLGRAQLVQILLRDRRVDPAVAGNFPIYKAALNGHEETVKVLLVDDRVDPGNVINSTAVNGNLAITQLLLQDHRVDPANSDNHAIRFAAEQGHFRVVQLLSEDVRVDPSADENYAIGIAYMYFERVKLRNYRGIFYLLSKHPKVLESAFGNGQYDIVKLLVDSAIMNPSVENNKYFKLTCDKLLEGPPALTPTETETDEDEDDTSNEKFQRNREQEWWKSHYQVLDSFFLSSGH